MSLVFRLGIPNPWLSKPASCIPSIGSTLIRDLIFSSLCCAATSANVYFWPGTFFPSNSVLLTNKSAFPVPYAKYSALVISTDDSPSPTTFVSSDKPNLANSPSASS